MNLAVIQKKNPLQVKLADSIFPYLVEKASFRRINTQKAVLGRRLVG